MRDPPEHPHSLHPSKRRRFDEHNNTPNPNTPSTPPQARVDPYNPHPDNFFFDRGPLSNPPSAVHGLPPANNSSNFYAAPTGGNNPSNNNVHNFRTADQTNVAGASHALHGRNYNIPFPQTPLNHPPGVNYPPPHPPLPISSHTPPASVAPGLGAAARLQSSPSTNAFINAHLPHPAAQPPAHQAPPAPVNGSTRRPGTSSFTPFPPAVPNVNVSLPLPPINSTALHMPQANNPHPVPYNSSRQGGSSFFSNPVVEPPAHSPRNHAAYTRDALNRSFHRTPAAARMSSTSATNGGVGGVGGNYRSNHHHTSFSNVRSTTGVDDSLSIRNIVPVKEALSLLRDGAPPIVGLAQTVAQQGRVHQNQQRERILNFKGFAPGSNPRVIYLTNLSKSDLEILAWICGVSIFGKKEDVAKRIIASLMAPLQYRVPEVGKRPHIPLRIEARFGSSTVNSRNNNNNNSNNNNNNNNAASSITTSTMAPSGALRGESRTAAMNTRGRSNMPILPASTDANGRRDAMIQNLSRGLEAPSSAVGADIAALASTSQTARATSAQNRTKPTATQCHELIQGFDFKVGENAFNEPLNAPLGQDGCVFFTSTQLNRSEDPVLKFPTPRVITTSERPDVAGGDVQVHLRCLRVEADQAPADWKQTWPFPAECRVNGQSVKLNQAQRYTNGKLAGRDAATNISPFLRKYSSTSKAHNKITLKRMASSASSTYGQYVLVAQEILVYSHETMMSKVSSLSMRYWQEYRQQQVTRGSMTQDTSDFEMAKHGVKLFMNDPDGVTVSSMKVSLRCPLALTRIEVPVKGRICHHVQCFDLGTFLQYARRSSKFDCPVCNKPTAHPSCLVISPYIQRALEEFKDCDEVEIQKSGEMVAVERKQTGVASDDEETAAAATGVDIDMSGGDGAAQSGAQPAAPGHARATEVVDLTLDSDDDVGNDDHAMLSMANNGMAATNGEGMGNGVNGGLGGAAPNDDDDEIDFTFSADFCWNGDQSGAQSAAHPNGEGQTRPNAVPGVPQQNRPVSSTADFCDVITIDD